MTRLPSSHSGPTLGSLPALQAIAIGSTRIERQYWQAFGLTFAVCVVFAFAYHFERNVLDRHPADIRFIREATEAGMRYVTIPHILIGFLFLASSPKNRTPAKRRWIVGLLGLGAALCGVYYLGGGSNVSEAQTYASRTAMNGILMVSVYLYFLVHELRDEAMFYQVLGDAPQALNKAAFHRMVRAWIIALLVVTATVGWALVPLGLAHKNVAWDFSEYALPIRLVSAIAPLVCAIYFAISVLRRHAPRLECNSVGDLLRTHGPFFRVSLGVLGVLGVSLLLTQRPYSLITFHVAGWYVFASTQFRKHPPKAPPVGLWQWMRTTFAGFQWLHVGMIAVLMMVGLVWTLGLDQTPWLKWLLAPQSFLYWTIMHITVSFVPR